MSLTITYDGDFTIAAQNGPLVPWWDPFTLSKLYRQPMVQMASAWSQQGYTLTGPNGGYLVSESVPEIRGSLAYWDRTFAWVPATRVTGESISYGIQVLETGGTSGSTLVEIPVQTTAYATYEYYYTSDPTTIAQLRTYRIGMADGVPYSIGTAWTPPYNNVLLADSMLSLWKGYIWQRKSLRGNLEAIAKSLSS